MAAVCAPVWLLMLGVTTVGGAVTTPVDLWPLGSETLAYDVMAGNDATFPTLSTCMTYADGVPSLGYSALDLNGTANKAYVEVRVAAGAISGSFSLAVSVFSTAVPSGPLLHYVADTSNNQGFTEVKVSIGNTNSFSYKFSASGSTGSGSAMNSGSPPPAGTWLRYTVTMDTSTGQVVAYLDKTVLLNRAAGTTGLKLATPGTLKIGTDGSSYLVARVTCASLHAQSLTGADLTDAINACALPGSSWSQPPSRPPCTPAVPTTQPPTTQAPTTQPTTTQAPTTQAPPPSPIHVIGLNNVTLAYDVIGNIAPAYATENRCTRLAPGHTSLPFSQATLFDGSTAGVPTLSVSMATFQGDFTLTVFLQPNGTSRGVLWEVMSQGQTTGINRIRLELDGPALTFKVFDVTSGLCGSVVVSNAVTAGSWELVTARRETSNGNLHLVLGTGSPTTAPDSCVSGAAVSATGSILIGGDGSRDSCVRATMQCLTVFPSVVDVTSGIVEDTCNDAIGQSSPSVAAEDCSRESDFRFLKSAILVRDKIPAVGYGPLAEVTARSVRACAALCLNSDICRSFLTVMQGGGSGVTCRLYDFVTSTHFADLAGATYFLQVF